MRKFLTATCGAAAISLCSTYVWAAPASGTATSATMVQPAQYGGPYNGDYPPYRRACNFGYHYTCVYEYSGYRRCGCQADSLYSPNPYYGYGVTIPVPRLGYDRY